jgi:glycosyltransferase involved in cell wall biosynthesis
MKRIRAVVPRVRAWVVGDGPLRSQLQELAIQLGIAEHCRFWGYQDNVRDLLNAGDLLIMTSDTEGIPAVALEAGYLGVPVVATRVGAMEECVSHGTTGILVSEPFEEELAAAVIALAEDEAMRARMGDNARRLVRSEFAIELAAERYLRFYTEVAQGRRPDTSGRRSSLAGPPQVGW